MAGNYRFYNKQEEEQAPFYTDNSVELGAEDQDFYQGQQDAEVPVAPAPKPSRSRVEPEDVTNYYQNPVEDYVKPMPDNMTYPAHSLIPKERLADPSRPLPYDINPADWKTGDDATDAERNQRKMVRNYTQQLYEEMAKTGDIDAARKEAARNVNLANVGQGLEQMFKSRSVAHGGPGVDTAYWDAQRKGAQTGVDNAELDRRRKIEDYITKKKLGSESVSELQQMKELDTKNNMNDPESNVSRAYQQSFKLSYGDSFNTSDPETGDEYNAVDTMSANDIMAASKMMEGKARLDMTKQLGLGHLEMDRQLAEAKKLAPRGKSPEQAAAELERTRAQTGLYGAQKARAEKLPAPTARPANAVPGSIGQPAPATLRLTPSQNFESETGGTVLQDNYGNFYDQSKTMIDPSRTKKSDPSKNKAMSSSQADALRFWDRAERNNSAMDGLSAKGYKTPKSAGKQVVIDHYLQSSGASRMLAKKTLDPDDIAFADANMNFLNSVLRQDSGAAIPEGEYAKYKPMLPEYGDTDEILKQKKAERDSVIQSLGMSAGDSNVAELKKRRTPFKGEQKEALPENTTPYAPDIVKALEFVKKPENKSNPNYEQVMDILRKKGALK